MSKRDDLDLDQLYQAGSVVNDTERDGQVQSDPNVLAYLTDAFPEATTGVGYPPRDQSSLSVGTSHQTHLPTLHSLPSVRDGQSSSSQHLDSNGMIDPQLADLAAIAAGDSFNSAAYSTDLMAVYNDYGTLGEMGGKRRKMPHERAGWTEMDQTGPRKRGRKRAAGNSGEDSGQDKNESQLSRAEQNKRAQQAFRRRREEKMKDLEHAAAELPRLEKLIRELEGKLKDTNLALEASKIETSAIKSVLLDLVREHRHSILKTDGTLALHPSSAKSGMSTAEELDAAFAILARQAKDLASANADAQAGEQ